MKQYKQPLWLNQYAKDLRKNRTEAEHRLWYHLRARSLDGVKFRRQVPMGHYIADFLCYSSRFIVELDGSQHQELAHIKYDEERTQYFESLGYRVLRISNEEIFNNLSGVLDSIVNMSIIS
jgi:very-short-patch-repair endonuclease